MKQTLIHLLLLSCFSCSSSATAENTTSPELNGFKQAFGNVHYIAKIKMTSVKAINENDEADKHVYSAEVLATYKGKPQQNISYEMFVEQDENVMFNSATIYIALCLDNKGIYYWPGTGSEFKYSSVIDTWLTENKTKLENTDSSADWCK